MANALNTDLENKVVLVGGRKFRCLAGFGTQSFTSGQKIYGEFVETGEKATISGYDVESLIE